MNISTIKPKFKPQRVTKSMMAPILGIIYYGDTGNANYVSGLLIQVDGSDATLVDARGKSHVVISSTLRSAQVTK